MLASGQWQSRCLQPATLNNGLHGHLGSGHSPEPSTIGLQSILPPFNHLQNNLLHMKTMWNRGPSWRGLLEVAFAFSRRLSPNSSPSKVRLNPDEPNLWLSANSALKASPPRVGVEVKLLAFIIVLCKMACAIYHHATLIVVRWCSFYVALPFWVWRYGTKAMLCPYRNRKSVASSGCIWSELQKGLARDIGSQSVMVIPLATLARSMRNQVVNSLVRL
jgi:hypothetical protein